MHVHVTARVFDKDGNVTHGPAEKHLNVFRVEVTDEGNFEIIHYIKVNMNITHLLEKSTQHHDHLCPRQILGVRIGLAGMKALGFSEPPIEKQLLVISETDGCFVDGVIAATDCTVGHRTLRVEDYGKVAVTFVDTKSGRTIRVARGWISVSEPVLLKPTNLVTTTHRWKRINQCLTKKCLLFRK